eukprot:9858955-Lingulodinium_polyedra.AAC.1
MGGSANTVLWNMAYNPIVIAIGGPTFVDDLAGPSRGPRLTLRVQPFLLAATHATKQTVATYHCVELVADN